VKILSTGDWHFNAGYDTDVLGSVKQITDCATRGDIDLIVITGDVYERASDPGSRNLASECIQNLANIAPVVVVRGNHDAPGDLQIYSILQCKTNIQVFESPRQLLYTGVIVHVMPWLTKAKWQSLHPGASKEEGDKTVSQMALDFLKASVALNPNYKHILVGHMTIAGAMAQNHQQLGADGVTLGLYDIKDAGFYAAMLGHIHLRQDIGGPRYFYNGSIAALSYGESPKKYFSVLDTDTGDVEWILLNTIHRQDVNAKWTPSGIGVDLEGIDLSLLKGARVRANLRVEGGDNIDQAKAQLADWLKNEDVLEYQINPQVIPASKVRAVEITKAIGMGDKLKEYWKATSDPDQETQSNMLDKLAEMEDECSL
jgi:DNA repair exonuclease SbcCD nuclease subunit